jgi:hypothetical protein
MTLKTLMRAAYNKQTKTAAPAAAAAAEPKPAPAVTSPPPPPPPPVVEEPAKIDPVKRPDHPVQTAAARKAFGQSKTAGKPVRKPPAAAAAKAAPPLSGDYLKLVTLHEQGILTDQEFQAALGRLMAAAK